MRIPTQSAVCQKHDHFMAASQEERILERKTNKNVVSQGGVLEGVVREVLGLNNTVVIVGAYISSANRYHSSIY